MSLLLIAKTVLITKEHPCCLQYICAMQWSHIQDPNLKAVSTLVAQTLLRRWCQDYFFLLPISKGHTADLPEQKKRNYGQRHTRCGIHIA